MDVSKNPEALLQALLVAQGLNSDVESANLGTTEYVRGQAELICDLFGIDIDRKGDVASIITAGKIGSDL